jgi:1-deoxy-D-xylulose-5-phosphate synthase
MVYLDKIKSPRDVQTMGPEELDILCQEIRQFLVDNLSHTGGHLASNLGTVELTVALHRVYDTQRDRLVFDVGHQCYTHKLLTGRMDGFSHLRALGGLSGFPKPTESVHDAFIAGHASNSVSVALGMARARTALGADYKVVALIGDGALNGGMAFEGLSDAGHSGEPLVVILNDNGMSINRGVGGLAEMLGRMRIRPEYLRFKRWIRRLTQVKAPKLYRFMDRTKNWLKDHIFPANVFDDLGFEYMGPMDGHDIQKVESALRWAVEQNKPCLVHVVTQKGRGYAPAEKDPATFHGVGAFDAETGKTSPGGRDFSAVFGDILTRLADEDDRVVAITAAMKEGTGLENFQKAHPDRFFDVGIAEEHACAMAGGMAAQGLVPVFAVYSTFLQRSYDMLIHDVSLMHLHVVLGVDRAGIVGRDGQTHQGVFDVSYLSTVPGMTIYAPSSFQEMEAMLKKAVQEQMGPVAVRYPRGGEGVFTGNTSDQATALVRPGTDATAVCYGMEINECLGAADMLAQETVSLGVVKINRLAPLDVEPIAQAVEKTGCLVIAEDGCQAGGMGERVLSALAQRGVVPQAVRLVNLGSGILEHGSPEQLREKMGLDGAGIARAVKECLHEKNKT